jgi:hypothetical protein
MESGGQAWWVTARWEPGTRRVYTPKVGWHDQAFEGAGIEFHWTVLCPSAAQATEIIRKRGYFLAGLDTQFACTAYEVALLDTERPAKVSEQPQRCPAVEMGLVASSNDGAVEAPITGIVMLARRFREFVFQA